MSVPDSGPLLLLYAANGGRQLLASEADNLAPNRPAAEGSTDGIAGDGGWSLA